ncbi:MAG: NUDIX domain-containing protein [Ignavibacterium sp.]|nr:MAG: NUDIX domain-containing protein [Ignavibacterium sp.]
MKIISNLIEAHIFRETEKGIEFLLLKRAEDQIYPGVWQMVSGKIKDNEKAYETAVRELKEETGLIPLMIWSAPKVNSFYSADSDTINLIPIFAIRVEQNVDVILSSEHTEFKWAGSVEAQKLLAWHGQRQAVRLIEEYFLKERSFLNFVQIDI